MQNKWIYIILICVTSMQLRAEGTKELRPSIGDWGNVEINDQGRDFAKYDKDSLQRLYIHISSITETIYFGFQPENKTLGTGKYRIKDAAGNVVFGELDVPVASGAGYIEDYAQACAGPLIGGLPIGGYNPLSFSPATTGDFYIEFYTSLGGTYHFDLFDITVVNAANQPILGRLWSYAWDLSARGSENRMQTIFYIYSKDKYLSAVDLNGIQPHGFVISSNSTGTSNTGNLFNDRKSVDPKSTYSEYKLFLNTPDPAVYDIATPPAMIEDLKVLGTPMAEEDILFYLNMNKAGNIEIFLDLDGIAGYQPSGRDVVLVKTIKAGGDTIIWNSKDGLGDFVIDDVIVGVNSRFATGVTHLPLWDPENNTNGFIVNRIAPESNRAELYWDDSGISGTVEFEGVSGDTDGHSWTGNFGNEQTLNTWWNGYENNDLKSFAFTMNGTSLPIELVQWQTINKGSYVQLLWTTASERENNIFEIEKSSDGIIWTTILSTSGAGNSSKLIRYSDIDEFPLAGYSYYRLKQTDINGDFSFSAINTVFRDLNTEGYIKTYTNSNEGSVTIEGNNIFIDNIIVRTIAGVSVNSSIRIHQISPTKFKIDMLLLPIGTYIIHIRNSISVVYKL